MAALPPQGPWGPEDNKPLSDRLRDTYDANPGVWNLIGVIAATAAGWIAGSWVF